MKLGTLMKIGLRFSNEWIKKNVGWIKSALEKIGMIDSFSINDLHNLYTEINKKDWRHNSCGGCI